MTVARPAVLLWARAAGAASQPASGGADGSDGIPLGAVIGIVLAATAIVCICLAFICIWLSRKKALREERDMDVEADVALGYDAGIIGAADLQRARSSSPRKLRKRGLSKTSISVDSFSMHSKEATASFSALPPSQSYRRQSFHLFSAAAATAPPPSNPRHSRRPSNAWVDEDAFHGPKVAKHSRDSWRQSIRDSWPLRNLSMMRPTLPKLGDNGESRREQEQQQMHEQRRSFQERQQGFQYQHQDQLFQITNGLADPFIPARELPQPPHPVVLTGGRESVSRVPSLRTYNTLDQAQRDAITAATPTCRRSMQPRPPRRRETSTDSTLSEILRSTEQRLQEGGTSGVARRNRANTSPSKTLSRDTLLGGPESGLARGSGVYASRTRTPSPIKNNGGSKTDSSTSTVVQPPPVVLSHTRHVSQSSEVSEPDSPRDEAAMAAQEQTGLTSPSRTVRASDSERRRRSRSESMTSSVSSALSTLYSEDEAEAAAKAPTAAGNGGHHAGNHRMGQVLAAVSNGPSPTLTTPTKQTNSQPTRTPVSEPTARGQSRYAILNGLNSGRPNGHLSLPPLSTSDAAAGPSPLGTISGNSKLLTGSPTRKPRHTNRNMGGGGDGSNSGNSNGGGAANDLYKLVGPSARHANASRSVIVIAPSGAVASATSKTAQRATMPAAIDTSVGGGGGGGGGSALSEKSSTESLQRALADLVYASGGGPSPTEGGRGPATTPAGRVKAHELRAMESSPTLGRGEPEWRDSLLAMLPRIQTRAPPPPPPPPAAAAAGEDDEYYDGVSPLSRTGSPLGGGTADAGRLAPGVARNPSRLRNVSTASSEYSQPSVADLSRTTSMTSSSTGGAAHAAANKGRPARPAAASRPGDMMPPPPPPALPLQPQQQQQQVYHHFPAPLVIKPARDAGDEAAPQVAAIVANLRRMNSQVSVTSVKSRSSMMLPPPGGGGLAPSSSSYYGPAAATASSLQTSPTLSSLRSGWGSQVHKGATRHYLALGQQQQQQQPQPTQQQEEEEEGGENRAAVAHLGGRTVNSPEVKKRRKDRDSKRVSVAEDAAGKAKDDGDERGAGDDKTPVKRSGSSAAAAARRARKRGSVVAEAAKLGAGAGGAVRLSVAEVAATDSPPKPAAAATPAKWASHLLGQGGGNVSPDRRSEDSLGLYDKDGFLIPSPDKTGLGPGRKRAGSIRV